MDHFRAVGYPDDPEVVNNPYRVGIGLFLGAPSLRHIKGLCSPPALLLARPSFSAPRLRPRTRPPSSLRRWARGRRSLPPFPGERATGRDEDRHHDDEGCPRARSGDAPDQGHPVSPRCAHRDGPPGPVRVFDMPIGGPSWERPRTRGPPPLAQALGVRRHLPIATGVWPIPVRADTVSRAGRNCLRPAR